MQIDPLESEFRAGAIRALRSRAAARRKSAAAGVTRDEKGCQIVSSAAAADLKFARDLESVADQLEAQARREPPNAGLCVNRRHAQHVSERFVEAGVVAEYMAGLTPREEREAIFDCFRSGKTRIICNVGVLTIGVDLDVRCIIDAKPTKSRILFVQTIGRGLRTAEGKDHLLILDNVGDHLRHRSRPSRRRQGATEREPAHP
jgi:superfamily II DNA or RNA helicase